MPAVENAVLEVRNLIATISCLSRRDAKTFVRKLEGVYASANFGREDLDPLGYSSLYQADLCKAIMAYVGYEKGVDTLEHDELEAKYAKRAQKGKLGGHLRKGIS